MGHRRRLVVDRRLAASGSHALLAVWAIATAGGAHRSLSAAAALYFGLLALVTFRAARLVPRCSELPRAQLERVRGLLEPLCERARCAVPEVRVVPYATGMANARVTRRGPRLTLSAWLLFELPDSQLAAVLAHELSHVVLGDCRHARRRQQAVLLAAGVLAWTLYAWTAFDPTVVPIVIAAITLLKQLAAQAWAPRQRLLEVRADAYAVTFTDDREALALALDAIGRRSEELLRRLRGEPPISWLLAPLLTPATTHNPVAVRAAAAAGRQPPAA